MKLTYTVGVVYCCSLSLFSVCCEVIKTQANERTNTMSASDDNQENSSVFNTPGLGLPTASGLPISFLCVSNCGARTTRNKQNMERNTLYTRHVPRSPPRLLTVYVLPSLCAQTRYTPGCYEGRRRARWKRATAGFSSKCQRRLSGRKTHAPRGSRTERFVVQWLRVQKLQEPYTIAGMRLLGAPRGSQALGKVSTKTG